MWVCRVRRVLCEQPFQCGTVRQVVQAGHLTAADVDERGLDGLQGHALLLGPGEAVDRELEGSAVRVWLVFQSTISYVVPAPSSAL